MVGRWLAASALALLAVPVLSAISASIDRAVVEEGGSVRLTIETDGPTVLPESLDPLREDFSITGTREASSFTFVNGVQTTSKKIFLTLLPKRSGNLIIPAIHVGSEQSEPISLTVTELTEELRKELSRLAFIILEADPKIQYIHAPVKITRKFYYSASVQIASTLPSLANIDDARVVVTESEHMSSAKRDGASYNVVSQEFTIYPEKSGLLVLPVSTVGVYLPIDGQERQYRDRRISSNALEIEVLPVPAAYPADLPWFPAYGVEMERLLDPEVLDDIKVGQTIRDEVTIVALGSYGAAIPPLDYGEPPGFKVYSDSPMTSDGIEDGMSIGTYYQNTSLVAAKPGTWVLDPIQVHWWNLGTGKPEVSTLPGVPATTKAVADAQLAQSPQPADPEITRREASPATSEPEPAPPEALLQIETSATPWTLVLWVGLAGALAGSLLTWFFKPALRLSRESKPAVAPAPSLHRLQANLQAASTAIEKKRLFLEWFSKSLHLDQHSAALSIISDEEGRKILSALNAEIFSERPIQSTITVEQMIDFLRNCESLRPDSRPLVPDLYAATSPFG